MTVSLVKTTTAAAEPLATLATPKGTRLRMADGNTGTLRWINHEGERERLHGIELDEIGERGITATWAKIGTCTVMADQTPPAETAHDKQNRMMAEWRAARDAEAAAQKAQPAAPTAKVNVPSAFAEWLRDTGAILGDDDNDPDCLALRLAYEAGRDRGNGRAKWLEITGTATVMDMLVEYAEHLLGLDDLTEAEEDGAQKTHERARKAKALLKATKRTAG